MTISGTERQRVVEAYVGEYASGKSENAVNRALELLAQGRRPVTIVDLDIVEPFYTLRPIKKELEEKGLQVVAWETRATMGLGEAGTLIRGDMLWSLRREGDLVLDIGYGVEGSKTLNLLHGAHEDKDLRIIAVINASRPMTASVEEIVDHVRGLGPVHGLLNNTHLAEETDLAIIREGARLVDAAARELDLPVMATAADERFRGKLAPEDVLGQPVRFLQRFMPRSFW
ncbi:hypothetical protein GTO89_07645 [Heliobacterium gestii]|uniref:Uncharacterized protein n=1 Tax=Heliomicrobium gestii TaxID=2699 RepID=A0A845LDA1_HELGE|nr:hypothetical protein [Heliomicrobium gestii]MBM7866300.1 hypothetical protein [Heliomicrobium gestii]MZP42910.1 hypothetical protein [Heliomicrobium gestii]